MPLSYFQGLTHSASGSWFFDGVTVGLFRTDRRLAQKASNPNALTPELTAQGFNHVAVPNAMQGGASAAHRDPYLIAAPILIVPGMQGLMQVTDKMNKKPQSDLPFFLR